MVNYLGNRSKKAKKVKFTKGNALISARLDREVSKMYAVIDNGGKQYKVTVGEVVRLEKIKSEVGEKIEFSPILVSDENGVKFGADAQGFKVVAEVVEQAKDKKIVVFKYKAKKNIRKKQGHRQPYTAVKIAEILAK